MTKYMTTDWGFTILSNISFGDGPTGQGAEFRFFNNKTGENAKGVLTAGGGSVSAFPCTFEVNFSPKPMKVRANRPIDFSDLHDSWIAMGSAGFSPIIHPWVHKIPGVIMPTESHIDIAISDKKAATPKLLMNIYVNDKTNLGNFRFSTPNGGVSAVTGKLRITGGPVRPMFHFPVMPVGPVTPPVPPTPPGPPPKPPRPVVPPKPPRRFDISADVAFDFDTARLKNEAYSQLFEIMTELNSGPWSRVRIEGHADSAGSVAYNQDLSLARAYAVRDWLGQQGAKNARGFEVIGHSELKPKASNATAAGRALNRRVEVSLFQ